MSATSVAQPDAHTILIVDDVPANLAVVVNPLEERGFRVVIAQDGEEGLQRAQFAQPDLILLDVMMPGLDGFETCRRLKMNERTTDIPVIFMTALAGTANMVEGFSVGGVDYVVKPFQIAEVLARVNTHLALRSIHKQLGDQNVQLQQEIAGRQQAEAALRRAHDELEERVAQRTAELANVVDALHAEIAERKQAEERIRYLAHYDALTGLPNRALLGERLEHALQAMKSEHRPLGLLLLGVDRYQEINETLGYREGDQLLLEIAQRLGRIIGENEPLARVGDAEFALLLPNRGAEDVVQLAQRLVTALYDPVEVSGLVVDAQATLGIALYPGHGTEPEALIRRANVAMRQARRAAVDYAVYSGGLDQENTRRLALMGDLRRAIEHNELQLYCQPKVDIASALVCGAEALVRWQHPQQGLLSADRFIKIAEHAGLITPLTHWVLEAAFRQGYAWHELGLDRPLSINLSAHDLRDPTLLDRVKGLFSTWGNRPESIQFELTESALMEDPTRAMETLTRLKQLDVELSIDDFGTGYSSLSYLQKLPVDSIKIDQSFVMPMLASNDSAVIVRSTIDLGHNLNLEVVAEGVESLEVWERLAALGCDTAQGYFIGSPMPTAQLMDWEDHSRWHR